jgi:3-oxoacyl-[acyl-carrier protein] reductase
MIPDILINNAGISYVGLLQDMSPEEWRSVIDTNLTSAFNCSKCAIPYMLKKHSGRIVNISSMWGNVGASCEVAYSASKGGINTFTKALAKELAPSGIAVNAIAFGMVDTRMNAFLDEEEKASLIEEIPAGRILSPQESADIIYSVSMMNSYVTGQIITADGGMT